MTRWLTLIGLGEDASLSPAASRALAQAELVVGGRRHLDLVGPVPGKTLSWPSPIESAFPEILAHRGRPVVVLASGDPFYHGIGSLLTRHVDPSEIETFPAPSAYTLAAARMGWAGQDCVRLSLHGRALERIQPHLHPEARLLVLSWDEATPAWIATRLTATGFGPSRLTVMERMDGPSEKIRSTTAAAFDLKDIDPLNTVALEIIAETGARPIPFTPGLPDDWFEQDGQITKREIRAVTLSALRPMRGQLLWDIGAGSGSVGIEWMLSDPSCRAIAIEPRDDRLARIKSNAERLGVPDLHIVKGTAPDCLADLDPPDAIFIGGGAGTQGLIDTAIAALKPGGRLVINAVTLETHALLVARHGQHGGDLIEMSVSRVENVGSFRGLRPAMAVLQWTWVKP